jgi:hypothetical protein
METFLITFLCGQLVTMSGPQYNSACTNFTNASFIQSGLHNDINSLQNEAEKIGVKERHSIEETTGRTPWDIATVGYIGYNMVRTQNLQYSLVAKPFADRLSVSLSAQTQNISLQWDF